MPELPEVETTRRDLLPNVSGRRIVEVWLAAGAPEPQAPLALDDFRTAVCGRRIETLERRGKYLIAPLDSGLRLVIHRRMTGNLVWRAVTDTQERSVMPREAEAENPTTDMSTGADLGNCISHLAAGVRFLRGAFGLDDGSVLLWDDQRRFGTWTLVEPNAPLLPALGPEPLDPCWTADHLATALARRGVGIKAALLDQATVAGLGNIYADEALHRAGIHPESPSRSLSPQGVVKLHDAVQSVLRKAIDLQGSSARNYVGGLGQRGTMQEAWQVYERGGQPCYGCGASIVKSRVAGRGTHVCPQCQPRIE